MVEADAHPQRKELARDYTAYGQAGSIMSSLAMWAIIAGLA